MLRPPPGVGKTVPARHYANWDRIQGFWDRPNHAAGTIEEIRASSTIFYSAPVAGRTDSRNQRPKEANKISDFYSLTVCSGAIHEAAAQLPDSRPAVRGARLTRAARHN